MVIGAYQYPSGYNKGRTQDGGSITPSVTITAYGAKQISSAPSQAQVYFSNQGMYAPQLSELSAKNVNLNFNGMKAVEKDALINEIGNQTYRWVKLQRRGCTACCPGFAAFFKPQITPEALQDAAGEIANNVVSVLQKRTQQRVSTPLSASGHLIYSNSPNKSSMEMREIGTPSIVEKAEVADDSLLQL